MAAARATRQATAQPEKGPGYENPYLHQSQLVNSVQGASNLFSLLIPPLEEAFLLTYKIGTYRNATKAVVRPPLQRTTQQMKDSGIHNIAVVEMRSLSCPSNIVIKTFQENKLSYPATRPQDFGEMSPQLCTLPTFIPSQYRAANPNVS